MHECAGPGGWQPLRGTVDLRVERVGPFGAQQMLEVVLGVDQGHREPVGEPVMLAVVRVRRRDDQTPVSEQCLSVVRVVVHRDIGAADRQVVRGEDDCALGRGHE